MERQRFANVAATSQNENWAEMINRKKSLYNRPNDIRTEFDRDYTRILHSLAYRRLKRKTQVFFNTRNDHVCTRIEHINHVESVSFTVAKFLGLNTELTKAIAIGHDLGHAPFGHEGEKSLNKLSEKYINDTFWHEKHGLHCVDNLELLEDDKRNFKNLCLTYAVRDGIISHCGEVNENAIKPRKNPIDLSQINCAGEYQPYTWEACVVKISDQIAYIGRDLQDAFLLNFIGEDEFIELSRLARNYGFPTLNTTLLIHELITNLCENSSPEQGLIMSSKNIEMMFEVKKYNYQYIYTNKKLDPFKKYVDLVIKSIFEALESMYDEDRTLDQLKSMSNIYPELSKEFTKWLTLYSINESSTTKRYKNYKIYGSLESKKLYLKAVIDFIAGMTDHYAIKIFNELTKY